jgi:hypothetical protein
VFDDIRVDIYNARQLVGFSPDVMALGVLWRYLEIALQDLCP